VNRYALAFLSILTLACAAHAEPPMTDAKPASKQVVIYDGRMPNALCGTSPYVRGPAYAPLDCQSYRNAIFAARLRTGDPEGSLMERCWEADQCALEAAEKAKDARK